MSKHRGWALAGMIVAGVGLAWFALNRLAWAALAPHTGPQPSPPEGLSRIDAASCATCHPTQAAQWRTSRMARSMANPGFLADWHTQDDLPTCLACHAPLQDQQALRVDGVWAVLPWLVLDTAPNPGFDPALQREGVTCVACHLAPDGQIAVASSVNAPHGTSVVDLGMVCVRCHQMPSSPLDLLPRPLIDTAGEHTTWRAATGRTETCADCHMTDGVHDFLGGWHAPTVASGLRAELRSIAGGWEVTVTNEAGHHAPTGETSGAIELWATPDDGASILLERLTRVVVGPPWRETQDTTLRPTESRSWTLPQAEGYLIVARMERLVHLPEARAAARKRGAAVQEDVLLASSRLWAPGVDTKPRDRGVLAPDRP